MRVSSFGHLRIEAYLQLPAAFRSLSRPSSAPDAKAFTLCSFSLELSFKHLLFSRSFELLEFLEHYFFGLLIHCEKVLSFCALNRFIHLSVKLYFTQIGKTYNSYFANLVKNICPLICSFLLFNILYSVFNERRSSLSVSLAFRLYPSVWHTLDLSFLHPWQRCRAFPTWWAQVDSNHRPRAYQARALTT